MSLLKKLSTPVMEKHKHDLSTPPKDHSPPPAYALDAPGNAANDGPPDITAAFSNLRLSPADVPTPDHCIAHLKLLEAFHQLREDTATHDGLFGIYDSFVPEADRSSNGAGTITMIRDKRWAVYVSKAAKRFERWWEKCVEPEAQMMRQTDITTSFAQSPQSGPSLDFDQDNLPPLDVIMVWHAYQLNPRSFLEDCLRYGKMKFWRTGLPWTAINSCIDNHSFDFKASSAAIERFENRTGLAWDSNNDPAKTSVDCAKCSRKIEVRWTAWDSKQCWVSPRIPHDRDKVQPIAHSKLLGEYLADGLADKHFNAKCQSCGFKTGHDELRVCHFKNDVEALRNYDIPMPGTLLSTNGIPEYPIGFDHHSPLFPNRLINQPTVLASTLRREIKHATTFDDHSHRSMDGIRKAIEVALKDRPYIRQVNKASIPTPRKSEKIAIRKMMSRYWGNSSPFALDLVGAVVRQGSFIEKMHSIDWIHSPAATSTMARLIVKYQRYMCIIAKYPNQVAVPTLDVDLAWHTHQLSAPEYYTYTVAKTRMFIDHDDKIEETKLSTSFEWTSKTYQKLYNELYSECTCWYCEAIRESHTSSLVRAIGGASSNIQNQLDRLHSAADPHSGPHISSHSAIKPDTLANRNVREANLQHKLERDYQKACNRARKKGRRPPARTEYMYAYAYGYPMYLPYYAPYMGDPCVNESAGMYPSNPSCATFLPGAMGNCCAGACGGGVAAGSCGGSGAGGCAGGGSGGCGGGGAAGGCGGGGGGFGGGGFGGCGGGGGGGGCGGGGGGGGCGGGGGGC